MSGAHHQHRAVAWVAGAPIDESDVDAREQGLRTGPVAPTLPRQRTSEGRQLRRWLVQVLVAERLVVATAERLGLSEVDAPTLGELAPDRAALLGLGSVAADLLTRNALARTVFVAVTAGVVVSPESVERYYHGNPEQFASQEERVVRHQLGDAPPWRRTVRSGQLTGPLADAVFAAPVGETVGPVHDPLGTHTVLVEQVRPARVRSLAEARPDITARLLAAARRRAFTAWLDLQAAQVRLAPGYEHPGDPGQPDNTHRH